MGTSSKILIFASEAHVPIDEIALSHATEVRKGTQSIENTFYMNLSHATEVRKGTQSIEKTFYRNLSHATERILV